MRWIGPLLGAMVVIAAQQAPTFRTGIEVVTIDALVSERSGPILGLTREDFELRDNGIVQTIERVEVGSIPLDLALVLDTSASVAGEAFTHLQRAARAAINAMGPRDRAAVLAFSHRLTTLSPLTSDVAALERALGGATPTGSTALYDSVIAGLLTAGEPGRRALVVVYSDGIDTASWLASQDAVETATRTDAVLYAVVTGGLSSAWSHRLPGATLETGPSRDEFPPVRSGSQFVGDAVSQQTDVLRRIAEATGGRLLRATGSGDLERILRDIVHEFGQRYVLSYSPQGVERGGWHRVEVRLTRRRGQVDARRGYFGS